MEKDQIRIKKDLENLFAKYNLSNEINADMVIGWIATEDEPDVKKSNRAYQNKYLKYLEQITDIQEVNNFIGVFTEAWNYFPHQSLGGLSPMEVIVKK